MTQPPPQAPQQPQRIMPQPVPQTVSTATTITPDGTRLVVVEFASVNGTWVVFLDATSAKTVAAQIEREASAASSGLVLPPAGAQLPPPHVNGRPRR